MDTKRLTASEREGLVRLAVAVDILAKDVPEVLTARAGMIPGGRRDVAMMVTVIRKLLKNFQLTIPEEQRPILEHAIAMRAYQVGARRPGGAWRDNENYGMWLPFGVINVLLGGCHDKCALCDLDRGMRRACALRKVLDIIPNDVKERTDGDCPYFTLI